MNGKLLKIRGVWVRDPDPDSWSPVHYPEWTAGSGRTASGCSVGAIKHRKWKLPLSWTNIPEAEEAELEQLIEGGESFFAVEFYHRCGYIAITAYAGEFVPSGIVRTDSGIYYKKCTVSLVEQ